MDSPHLNPRKELFRVAGDAPDPTGSGLRGKALGYDLRAGAAGHPQVYYRLGQHDIVLELDVYQTEGAPTIVHVLCPICTAAGRTNMLTISSERKAIAYEPLERRMRPFPGWAPTQMLETFPEGLGGALSIEAFQCTWELTPEHRRQFGFNRCPWKVAIDHNIARDV